jgi:hypothetical protein
MNEIYLIILVILAFVGIYFCNHINKRIGSIFAHLDIKFDRVKIDLEEIKSSNDYNLESIENRVIKLEEKLNNLDYKIDKSKND